MNAAIDVGNTLVKVGIFEQDKMIEKHTFNSLEELKEKLSMGQYKKIIVASVKQPYTEIKKILSLSTDVVFLTNQTPIPFINNYKSDSLGIDRIALAAGAIKHFPQKNSLIIDLGTCITYDFINTKNEYEGGAISPGLNMRYKSLHTFTARLPLIDPEQSTNLDIGNTTESSIISGVTNGISGEIEFFISKIQNKFGHINVILSGGDAIYFESRIKATIFAIPELLLEGLNAILRHNASN